MANTFSPRGFQVSGNMGAPGHQWMEERILDKDYASSIFYGDPVKSDGAGGIQLASRGDTILGVFKGWRIPSRMLGSSSFAAPTAGMIPWSRKWTPGTDTNGLDVLALVHTDPHQLWEVQCIGDVQAADIGTFVNLEPGTGDSTNKISRYCIGPAINGGPITSVTVGGSGSAYVNGNAITVTRHASDPYTTAETAAGTIAVTTGNVTGVTVSSGGFYSASHLPTITAPTGTGNTFLAVITAVTRDQFQIVRVLERAERQVDSNNNTTGHGETGYGTYARCIVKCVNHEYMGSAYGVAV